MKRLLFLVAAIAAPIFSASAQANISFTGGSGTKLTMTLAGPVTYTINSTPTTGLPAFVFVGMGNVFPSLPSFTGSITYSINGAGAFALSQIGSGYAGGSIAATDSYLFSFLQPMGVGDVIRLNAGTLTSVNNFAFAAPTSRAYTTFIVEDGGASRSTLGTSAATVVPEPATFVLMGAGMLALFGVRTRRRS